MVLKFFIGLSKFFARARARIYRSTLALSFCFVCAAVSSQAQEPQFILGRDSRIHGIQLNHSLEAGTRRTLKFSETCKRIKKHATAAPLIGSEGASVDPHIKSTRGMIVLEGLMPGAEPEILHTALLSNYKNFPSSIPGEMGKQLSPRYALAVTIAATVAGQGDLELHKGDSLVVQTNGQFYSYSMPEITIPSEGLVRLYLGTDDMLYYDSSLLHPFHAGACGGKN